MPADATETNTATAPVETATAQAQPDNSARTLADAEAALAAMESMPTNEAAKPEGEAEPVVEPETTTEAEPETEPTEEAEPETTPEEPPKDHIGWRKRVDTLTARNKEKDAEIARLKGELETTTAKLATAPDAETLVKAGLPNGYVTADEAKVVAKDGELANAARWLREKPEAAIAELRKSNPDAADEAIGRMYQDWRESVLEQRMEIAGEAKAIKARVAKELAEDIAAARKAKGQKTTPTPDATTTKPPVLKAKPKPSGVLPAATVAGSSVTRNGGAKQLSRDAFKERAKQIGEMDAAAEALAAM